MNILNKLYKRWTTYSDPSQANTLTNGLELLSSGIYTEEERFIFELLQNAVDSFKDIKCNFLKIKILKHDKYLVFMHNGAPFSPRDLEGLCDIGNGNKKNDIKKIGYKGIGFKSVFIHSDCVTVKSQNLCFKFDKSYWENYWDKQQWGRKDPNFTLSMPWQIIPIVTVPPININTIGYNVVTYIKSNKIASLIDKTLALLSDCRFLLFLGVPNISIDLYDEHKKIVSLAKELSDGILKLKYNQKTQSRWLIHTEDLKIDEDISFLISHDAATPQKLKESKTTELSFAIALDENLSIIADEKSMIYTYLPTSYQFGFPFIVNANFITDAGRQQLHKDSEWNKFLFSKIPYSFLNWIANIARTYKDYYKVLPHIKYTSNPLGLAYSESMEIALKEIAFLPAIKTGEYLTVEQSLVDTINLHEGLPVTIYNNIVSSNIDKKLAFETLISKDVHSKIKEYGIRTINNNILTIFLRNANSYLKEISVKDCASFIKWLSDNTEKLGGKEEFFNLVSHSKFILDKKNNLEAPKNLFFPSKFRDKVALAKTTTVISPELLNVLHDWNLNDWLYKIGIKDMDNYSIIERVLCKHDFVTKTNAIEVMQFIFDTNKKENIFDKIPNKKLQKLKILTSQNNIEESTHLYLTKEYKTAIDVTFNCEKDVFVSTKYIRNCDDPMEWALFFKQLGVSDDISIVPVSYNKDSSLFQYFNSYVQYAEKHEYNHSSWTGGNYYMRATYIEINFIPLLEFNLNSYDLSKLVWNIVFSKPIELNHNSDYIFGSTGGGYTKKAYFSDNSDGHRYLGENVLPYLLKQFPLLPATNGNLYKTQELLQYSVENEEMCGTYIPILNVTNPIHSSWKEHLSFKQNLSLDEYLNILSKISEETDKKIAKENFNRVSQIYQKISNDFDLNIPQNINTIKEWGRTHKILSEDKTFKKPLDLILVSDDLGHIKLTNQIYKGKYIESRNGRFAKFMIALGVKFINTFEASFTNTKENISFKENLLKKCAYITTLVVGTDITKETFELENPKTEEKINQLQFLQNDAIYLSYGEQKIEKKTYIVDGKFYYSGDLNIATKELIHIDLANFLGIKANKATLLTLLQINDFEQIEDYLNAKGFRDLSFIDKSIFSNVNIPLNSNVPNRYQNITVSTPLRNEIVSISLKDTPYGNLSKQEMTEVLLEAKQHVKVELEKQGFTLMQGLCENDYGNIYGVMKDGVEYPIVVHSYKNQNKPFQLTAIDWEQLAQPNSMLWLHTKKGVICVPFYALTKNKGTINISFSADNFDYAERSLALAQILRYYKGLHFDFGSLIPDCTSHAEKFIQPEKQLEDVIRTTIHDTEENLL